MSDAAAYLCFLAAGVLAGTVGFLVSSTPIPVWALAGAALAAFVLSFTLASLATAPLFRLRQSTAFRNAGADIGADAVARHRHASRAIFVIWAVGFVVAFGVAFAVLPTVVAFPVATQLGLAIGNLGIFGVRYAGRRTNGSARPDYRPAWVGGYFFVTAGVYPLWLATASAPLVFGVLVFQLSVAYFGIAVSYALSARSEAFGILDAVR